VPADSLTVEVTTPLKPEKISFFKNQPIRNDTPATERCSALAELKFYGGVY
jgi:hypothetical protein